MQLYLFRSTPESYAGAFKLFYQPHNLKVTKIMAMIWFSIAVIVLGSNVFLDFGSKFPGEALYRVAYISYAVSSAIALLSVLYLSKNISQLLLKFVTLGYPFVFAITCLLMSVANQGNPVNNMTMYLMGLILVALLWVLELKQIIILIVLVELVFGIGVQFLNLNDAQMIANQTGSVFILLFFFLLSRLNYSFRVNHFIQLKRIEEKHLALEEVSKAKSEILRVVAHDLRGPYANIEMLVKLMQMRDLSAEETVKYFDMIQRSCQNSKNIINDLLEMAQFEQEDQFQTQKTDLNVFIEKELLEWQSQLAHNRQLTFVAASEPLYASINSDKFKRVLSNLLSNAVKFTKDDGQIHVSLSQQDRYILLQISDDGIGIPLDLKEHMFKPFTKASRRGLRGEKSVGLGLNIVQKLVEQHKGSIAVESDESKGTTFTLTLPSCN